MKNRVLIPTDFSKNAWNAILYASELYENEKRDFYLLNAFTEKAYDIDGFIKAKPGDPNYDQGEEESIKGLEETIKKLELNGINPKHKYFKLSIFGSPLDAIKSAIELKDIELVIMGTKGTTDDKSVFYGSNAIDVMEESRNCPILAIPGDFKFKESKEIVFPTSFKTHYKKRELQYLYEISKITGASVRILHVNLEDHLSELQNQNKDLLEDCLDGLDYSFHWIDNIEVNEGLQRFIKSRGSDMVVFINKKHSFLETLFSSPLVNDLGYNSKVPLLVLHDLRN